MTAWTQLRRKALDEAAAWEAFNAWLGPADLSEKARDERGAEFFTKIIPLVWYIVRARFRKKYGKDEEFDDLCSELYIKAIAKIARLRDSFFAAGSPRSFTRLLTVCLRNLIYDQIRVNKPREIIVDFLPTKTQVSVSKAVDIKLTLEELPERIAKYAAERDRFDFGYERLLVGARILIAGHPLPQDMVRNWLGVKDAALADRFVSFVTLMSRIYLFTFRDVFTPLLSCDQREFVEVVSGRAHLQSAYRDATPAKLLV